MKYLFIAVLLVHGLIHFMGFAKAFHYGDMKQLILPISKPLGMLWMLAALLFIATIALYLLKIESWWILALAAVAVSQTVIVTGWQDARFGTIANLVVLIAVFFYVCILNFEKTFRRDVQENRVANNSLSTGLLTLADLQPLPAPVQRYLTYTGAVNKPWVKNMHVVFDVQMRGKGKEFVTYTSEQFNFFDDPARLFFMKGTMFGLPVSGYHRYAKGMASMDIRLLGLIKVVNLSGDVLNKTETVTLFNDMCLMAPATLIDKGIKWEEIDNNTARAIFTNHGISVTATLFFNNKGQLVDFESDDRTEVTDMKQYPFTTPVSDYREINGTLIWTRGETIWHYPGGKFTYGKFSLREITYNFN
ncbi:MAG: DUF6544 family protein [Bacteroidota bacterium]